ncbi:MAG: 30S ribosomal protein THX [Bacteroidota bacterium]
MGKGDIKTRRGKLFNGSYGKRRPGKSSSPKITVQKAEKPKKGRTAKAG